MLGTDPPVDGPYEAIDLGCSIPGEFHERQATRRVVRSWRAAGLITQANQPLTRDTTAATFASVNNVTSTRMMCMAKIEPCGFVV